MDKLVKYISKNWYKVYLLLSIIIVVWIYGIIVGVYHTFPFHIIQNAKIAAEDWLKNDNYKHYLDIKPVKHLYPSRHKGNGVTINKHVATNTDYTIISSMWENINGIKLISLDGTEVHRWNVSYNSIFPFIEKREYKISDWDVNIHGFIIYPNGDIIFNFHSYGLVKMDKDSNVLWKMMGRFHHSIVKDDYENIWVLDRKRIEETDKNSFPLLNPPYFEDYISKISPDGEIVKEISILDLIFNSGLEALLFADGEETVRTEEMDFTHTNSIDIIKSDMVNAFPNFNLGDIMVNFRELNLIVVIDSISLTIKWYKIGPYNRQHDSDFTKNGTIIVFDNRTDNANGSILGGSRILEIDPVSRNVNVLYSCNDSNEFYTEIGGNQQLLKNNNLLITEYCGGRVFEVDENNQIVWTYINRYDEDEVYAITDAQRIPKNYLTFLN